MRDAHTKGNTLESGTTKKEKIESESALGLTGNGSMADGTKAQRPAHKPSTSAPDGHTIK